MAVVLKPFPYAGDGFTIEYLVPGDDRDFGDAASGLAAAGYIDLAARDDAVSEPVPADEPTEPLDGPDADETGQDPAPAPERKRK